MEAANYISYTIQVGVPSKEEKDAVILSLGKCSDEFFVFYSLPALPLWLSTLFTPEFYVMNSYWPPNLW